MLLSKFTGVALAVAYCIEAFDFGQETSSPLPLLLDATLDELREGLDHGEFTSTQLVRAYLARIEEMNPALRAVTEINPDALSIAAEMDYERSRDNITNLPLHGIPVLVKDNIATKDKMNNTAGSYALLGAKVPEDSTVVSRLRKAGAIILGKTSMSEWADMRSGNTSSGWSAYGGQTTGAYYPGQDPSGSSSGSGVASIGLAWASLGTDTSGSIVFPSSENNVVGIRPTLELVSRYLVVPISEHQDTVGPMARTVKDAAYLLSAIAGPDNKDNYTSAFPFNRVPDYVGACKSSGLEGKRLGVARSFINPSFDYSAGPAIAALEPALDILRDAGAEVIDNLGLRPLDGNILPLLHEKMFDALLADMLSNIPEKYMLHLRHNPNNIVSVADMRDFTQGHPLEDYPKRDTALWDRALENGFNNTSPKSQDTRDEHLYIAGKLGLMGAFEDHSLDAIVVPSIFAIPAASPFGIPVITVPWTKYPDNTTVETDTIFNLNVTGPNKPFGFGFIGPKWSEEALIGMAYAFEQKTLARRAIKPYTKPKTELADVGM